MRKGLLLFLFGLLFLSCAYSQPFGNEWIKYNQVYLKFPISQDGLYRIDYSTLQSSHIPLSSITGANFQVFGRGEEVPIYVTTSNVFTASDYIEFYALRNDGWLDSTVYDTIAWQGNDRVSLFTDTISYYLTWNNQTNNRRLADLVNSLTNHPAKEEWCWYTASAFYGGTRNSYFQGKPAYQGQPIFDSDLSLGEGYSGTVVTRKSETKTLSTPYPYTLGPSAILKAQWMSRLPVPHNMEVSMKGQLLQKLSYPQFNTQRISLTLPSNNLLTAGSSGVVFSSAASSSVNDANAVSYVDLKYPSLFNADNHSTFMFSLDASTGKKYFEVVNFNKSGTTPVLYDFTNNLRLTAIISNDTLKFQIPASTTERQLLLFANSSAVTKSVTGLLPVHFTDYSQPANQGDFIIISHPFFYDDGAGNNYIEEYKLFKNSIGESAIVVNIKELYDQFSYGVDLHPVSIRNFSSYILSKWSNTDKKHIFLIGKGIEFTTFNATPATRAHCYVPTFGVPGSDILLTAVKNNPTPRIPIGRIPALSANEVRIYLKKAKDFVAAQRAPQTIYDKAWMKRVLHLGGGENAQDQSIFQYYLNSYVPIIEDTLYGGKVYSFFKTSSEPIQTATSAFLDSLIDGGVSLINFFGHSSNNSFDFNLDHPGNYNNFGKYPVMISNGCLLGNMFQDALGLSDEFVFTEDRGAIAFIAAATFSVSNSLDLYTHAFYENLSQKSYNQTLGNILKNSVRDIILTGSTGVDKVVLEQMGLNGDPSLLINTHPKPDYVIEPASVSFNPSTVTAGLDSFKLHLDVTNIGKAILDSFYIDITRVYPDGHSGLIHHRKVAAPFYFDSFEFNIKTESFTSLGLNQFKIKIDANNHIDEISESNNELSPDLLILSDDIIPVYPYDFAIVGKQGVELKASTVNAFAAAKQYIFEIDTTELFNSPLKISNKILQPGGVVHWKPNITFKDSTVYYWRTTTDSIYGHGYSWHVSSFVYLNGSSPGWNQSHYYQFLKDKYGNVQLPGNRKFKYTDDVTTVSVFNGLTTYFYPNAPIAWDEPSYYINSVRMANWTCGTGANLMFAVIDSSTGLQWESVNQGNGYGQYKNIHCWPANLNAFYFDGNSQFTDIINFIDSIPKGNFVLVMSLNDPHLYSLPQNVKNAFHLLGASKIDTISVLRPYALFSKKGSTAYPVTEIVGDSFRAVIDTSFVVPGTWNKGYMESTVIGPAVKWTSLHWRKHELEPGNDNYKLEVYGINNSNTETLLFPNVIAGDTSISNISTAQYPFLKLRLTSQDTVHRTPVQLDYWRINFSGVPEAALNPFAYHVFTDTVPMLKSMVLDVAVENVSEFDMDSLTIKYVITDASNVKHTVYQKLDSLRANDTLHTNFNFPVSGNAYNGINHLFVEVNPYEQWHQQEQYHFNNLGVLDFTTSRDYTNPLLDVTFDGVHILDKDIISPKPNISIRLKDNNPNLPLDDTSLLKIYYLYPDGSHHKVYFDGTTNIFTPANPKTLAKNNTASAELKPVFADDGTYILVVQGYDRSGNASGDYDYQVSFEVINKSMISNIVNYPNPFTTQTRFVFMLTGAEIPTFMKIQIMTVTGKVVREIFKDELGPIHIGRNITEFAWNGTDQYGDALANGLYLYKVVTSIDNKQIDKYDTGTDKYFKHNIGKMYFMR